MFHIVFITHTAEHGALQNAKYAIKDTAEAHSEHLTHQNYESNCISH